MGYPPPSGIPTGAYDGTRAVTTQGYDETNKKNGTQWVMSRRIVAATLNGKYYSIIKSRTQPIDLKRRVFSYTGAGLIARFYTGFTPQTLPTAEPVYCLRPAKPAFRDFDLYVLPAAPASLGALWSAEIFLEGGAQVQGKGIPTVTGGDGWIIDPNQEILLEIESLDSQNISSMVTLYNGFLDLPLPK